MVEANKFKDYLTCATLHMLKQPIIIVFSWKTTIIYLKNLCLILNVQVPIQNFYFKLVNMYKFAHDRKPLIFIVVHLYKKKVKGY